VNDPIAIEAARLERVHRERRPKLSVRFNQAPMMAAQERADRLYFESLTR
jgi:hypothetical protein